MITRFHLFEQATKKTDKPSTELVNKAKQIAAFAKQHDVDCGTVFVKPGTEQLFVICGDGAGFDNAQGDKVNGLSYHDTLEKMAKELGFDKPELADEYFPKEGEGWVKVKKDGTTEQY